LTWRPGDLSEWGDERLKHREQVVLKPQNIPEQLGRLENGLPVQGHLVIPDLFEQAYQVDLLPNKILMAIPGNNCLKEITVAA
jgi:hypothetical protein